MLSYVETALSLGSLTINESTGFIVNLSVSVVARDTVQWE